MNAERRIHPRQPFSGNAYLTYNGTCRCEPIADVSEEGLLALTKWRLRPGKPIQIFLPIKEVSGWRMCLIKGEVARRGPGQVGIRFVSDVVDTRQLLTNYLAQAA